MITEKRLFVERVRIHHLVNVFVFNLQSQLNVFFLYKIGIMPLLIQLLNGEIE